MSEVVSPDIKWTSPISSVVQHLFNVTLSPCRSGKCCVCSIRPNNVWSWFPRRCHVWNSCEKTYFSYWFSSNAAPVKEIKNVVLGTRSPLHFFRKIDETLSKTAGLYKLWQQQMWCEWIKWLTMYLYELKSTSYMHTMFLLIISWLQSKIKV